MSTRTPPVTGARALWAAVLLVVGVLCGVRALTPLLQPGPWLTVSLVLVVLLAAVTSGVRHRTRSRSAPTLWGLAATVVALAAVYSGQGSSPTVPMPTPDTLERLVRLGRNGVEAIAQGSVPLPPLRGVELLVVAGALAAFLLADLVALGLGRAALSGLVLVALWVPAAVFESAPSLLVLLLAGTSYLLLLALTRPQARPGAVGREVATATAAAAVVTAVAVVAGPVAAGTPAFGAVVLAGGWGEGPGDGPLRVSSELDMRSSLADRSDRPILRYTTDASDLGPLRLYTVVDFDGTEWRPRKESGPLTDVDGVLWPTAPPLEPLDTDRVRVTVGDLDQDRLPIPVNPRSVEIEGPWRYDPLRDEVVTDETSTRGAVYELTVAPRALTADALRADGADGDVDPALLAVPESTFGAEIRATVAEVTAGAATTYDQAVALQSFFRNGGSFRYSTEVPPAQTDDPVWDFLTTKTGYCVQYATAMTLMARMIGIPSRLAVGFLPGKPDTEVTGQFVVTGRQAHAWPELYFADAGWVRFEPTPAAQTGAPPSYADPFAGVPITPPEQQQGATPTAAATPVAPGTTAQGGGGRVTIGSTEVPLAVALGGAGALLLLVVLAAVAVVRRRPGRHPALPDGPGAWWDVLRARLAVRGVTWTDATTPRQAAQQLRERYTEENKDAEAALVALQRLVAAVESERYAPSPVHPAAEELQAWVEEIERPWVPAERPELVRA